MKQKKRILQYRAIIEDRKYSIQSTRSGDFETVVSGLDLEDVQDAFNCIHRAGREIVNSQDFKFIVPAAKKVKK